ncbi:hypothetical protein ACMFMG_003894 [Clarireedia jacksonii]
MNAKENYCRLLKTIDGASNKGGEIQAQGQDSTCTCTCTCTMTTSFNTGFFGRTSSTAREQTVVCIPSSSSSERANKSIERFLQISAPSTTHPPITHHTVNFDTTKSQ